MSSISKCLFSRVFIVRDLGERSIDLKACTKLFVSINYEWEFLFPSRRVPKMFKVIAAGFCFRFESELYLEASHEKRRLLIASCASLTKSRVAI